MIRVMVLAPNLALRVGLRELLGDQPDLQVSSEAVEIGDLDKAALDADVVLLSGLTNSEIREVFHLVERPVLILATTGDEIEFPGATYKQAWGVLPVNATEDELAAAVRAVAEGLVVGSPGLLKEAFSRPQRMEVNGIEEAIEPLTSRELEVLQLMAQGLANKQIALSLDISEHTVKFHLSSIYSKLGVTNRIEAVNLGLRNGLIVL